MVELGAMGLPIALGHAVRTVKPIGVVFLSFAVLAPGVAVHGDAPDVRLTTLIGRYLDREPLTAPTSYRAFRRLEARGMGGHGWIEAWTHFDNGRLTYDVVAEGGSERIRNRVLHKVLASERQAWTTGEAQRSGVTLDNYHFLPASDQPGDLFKVRLKPRDTSKLLIDGAAFLTPDGSRLVRVEGRLSKNPSFWVRNVEVTRTYRPMAGANLLVEVGSRADLRFAGHGTFRMTYQYTHVNGRGVGVANTFASGAR